MKYRFLNLAFLLISYNTFAQCEAYAQYSWNVPDPVFGTNYYYLNIPYNATCQWTSVTAVSRIDIKCNDPTTNTPISIMINSTAALTGVDFRRESGTFRLVNLPMPGKPVKVTFIARDIYDTPLHSYSVYITVRPYP